MPTPHDITARFQSEFQNLKSRINELLWDEARGLYVNRHWDGRLSDRLSPTSFYPLYAGVAVEPLSAFSYAASKAAIQHLSRVLAAELAPHRITVNTVVPGYFPTQMTSHIRAAEDRLDELVGRIPLGRLGTAEDVAGACILLASRAGAGSPSITTGGIRGITRRRRLHTRAGASRRTICACSGPSAWICT